MLEITTQTAALALGIDPKLLDNLLAREARHLLADGRQGRSRRLSVSAIEILAVALLLKRDLGVSTRRGLELAERLAAAPSPRISLGRLGTLQFDLPVLRQSIVTSISEAIELVDPPRRGRPPLRKAPERKRGAP